MHIQAPHRATVRTGNQSRSTPGATTPEKSHEPLAPPPAYCQGVLGQRPVQPRPARTSRSSLRARTCAPGCRASKQRNHEHRRATPPPDHRPLPGLVVATKAPPPWWTPGSGLNHPAITAVSGRPPCAVVDTHEMKLYSGRDRSALSVDLREHTVIGSSRKWAVDESRLHRLRTAPGAKPSAAAVGGREHPVPVAVYVDVAAAHDRDYMSAGEAGTVFKNRGDTQRGRRFNDQSSVVEQHPMPAMIECFLNQDGVISDQQQVVQDDRNGTAARDAVGDGGGRVGGRCGVGARSRSSPARPAAGRKSPRRRGPTS